jgi:hypothetical protein
MHNPCHIFRRAPVNETGQQLNNQPGVHPITATTAQTANDLRIEQQPATDGLQIRRISTARVALLAQLEHRPVLRSVQPLAAGRAQTISPQELPALITEQTVMMFLIYEEQSKIIRHDPVEAARLDQGPQQRNHVAQQRDHHQGDLHKRCRKCAAAEQAGRQYYVRRAGCGCEGAGQALCAVSYCIMGEYEAA